ncbi:DELLA protein [Marchantia polymorpha subsp. ruderalis]
MEVDMRMFESAMLLDQQIQLEDYMFNEPPANVVYYGGQQAGGGGSWEIKDARALQGQVSVFAICSPSLSRSSSQVSTGSDSSLSYDNCNPPHRGGVYSDQFKAASASASLCSPLSELQRARSCTSSLQSFESEDLDDPRAGGAFSPTDMVVGSDTTSVTSQEHFVLHHDLSSFMESVLLHGSDVGLSVDPEYAWSPSSRQCLSSHRDAYSSPINVLDFPDSTAGASPPRADISSGHFVDSPPPLAQQQQQQQQEETLAEGPRPSSVGFEVGVGKLGGQAQGQWMRAGEAAGSSNDFFYQHLSSEISFQNCHTAHASGFQPRVVPQLGIRSEEDLNGIRLVHLLLAGAEAVASTNIDLATVILVRLKDLVSRSGSTMQRVAAYFCEGLQFRIEGVRGPDRVAESQNDSLSAFQVLHEVSPYIKFGHFTANQAILEAFEGERRVHIIDYDILEGIQWPSLMQALACRTGGPPHLRVTALCRPHVKRALAVTQETGKRLTEFAATFNIPFSFHQVRIDNEDELRPTLLKQVKGECLAVNCMVHLPHMPHRSKKAVTSFLRAVHRLSPKVLTLVEEELSCSSSTFVSHFFEALHHYSAIFDSLEASLSSESKGRQLVERIFLAPRITGLMTSSNTDSNPAGASSSSGGLCEGDGGVHWHSLAQTEGFHPVPLSVYNLCQAKLLLGLFSDGYKVEEEQNRLLLGWRSKILLGASIWQCTRYEK